MQGGRTCRLLLSPLAESTARSIEQLSLVSGVFYSRARAKPRHARLRERVCCLADNKEHNIAPFVRDLANRRCPIAQAAAVFCHLFSRSRSVSIRTATRFERACVDRTDSDRRGSIRNPRLTKYSIKLIRFQQRAGTGDGVHYARLCRLIRMRGR